MHDAAQKVIFCPCVIGVLGFGSQYVLASYNCKPLAGKKVFFSVLVHNITLYIFELLKKAIIFLLKNTVVLYEKKYKYFIFGLTEQQKKSRSKSPRFKELQSFFQLYC